MCGVVISAAYDSSKKQFMSRAPIPLAPMLASWHSGIVGSGQIDRAGGSGGDRGWRRDHRIAEKMDTRTLINIVARAEDRTHERLSPTPDTLIRMLDGSAPYWFRSFERHAISHILAATIGDTVKAQDVIDAVVALERLRADRAARKRVNDPLAQPLRRYWEFDGRMYATRGQAQYRQRRLREQTRYMTYAGELSGSYTYPVIARVGRIPR